MKIFWIGPLIPSKEINNWIAASPAAMKWQNNLIKSLIKNKVNVEWLYYRPEVYWPKGRLLPSLEQVQKKFIFKSKQIQYLNFPGIRNLSLKNSLIGILKEKYKINKSQSLILVSYNSPKWISEVFSNEEIISKFKRIYLIADNKSEDNADGYAFLSYEYFEKFKTNKFKLHFDGAVYPINKHLKFKKKISNKKKVFLYSGSFHKWGGAKMILESIKLIKNKNFEVWFSGPGDDRTLKLAAKHDCRIKCLGLVTEKKLIKLYQEADVFLNPRPINIYGNQFNFPSKLFDYLAWNKPIISTRSKSFSPLYKKILHIVNDNPRAFALAMKEYLDKKKIIIKNKHLITNKNWKNESKKLINLIRKVTTKHEN